MIYKRIISKIPAISSLFLAGLFLPGKSTCCSDDKDKKAQQPQRQQTDNTGDGSNHPINKGSSVLPEDDPNKNPEDDPNKNGDNLTEGSGINDGDGFRRDPEYIQAVAECFKHAINFESIKCLENAPPETDLEAIKKGGKEAARLVQVFYESNATNRTHCYPDDLKPCLAGLANEKFKRFAADKVRNVRGTKNKYAFALALNAITSEVGAFHKLFLKAKDVIFNQGAPKDEMTKLQAELSKIRGRIAPVSSLPFFNLQQQFFDSAEPKLLAHDRLCRFLTDADKAGTGTKPKQYNVLALMNDKKLQVYIKHKSGRLADMYPDAALLRHITLRGVQTNVTPVGGGATQTLPSLLVCRDNDKLSANTMPRINPINRFGLDKKFNTSTCRTAGYAPGTQPSISDFAYSTEELSFGQFLFSLFKGSGDIDFLSLVPGKENSSIKLLADDEKFKKVIEATKASNGDVFANLLGNHIKSVPALQEMFYVPDQEEIWSRFKAIENFLTGSQAPNTSTAAVPIKTGFQYNDHQELEDLDQTADIDNGRINFYATLIKGSSSNKLVDHILTNFFDVLTPSADANVSETWNKIVAIVKNHQNPQERRDWDTSNASFEQKIAADVIYRLFSVENRKILFESQNQNDSKRLLEIVRTTMQEHLDKSILFSTANRTAYNHTPVTAFIRTSLNKFNELLAEKHGAAHITYEDLEYEDKARTPKVETSFHINQINDFMEKCCDTFESIFKINVHAILSTPQEKVNYSSFIDKSLSLGPTEFKAFDKIREKLAPASPQKQIDKESPKNKNIKKGTQQGSVDEEQVAGPA